MASLNLTQNASATLKRCAGYNSDQGKWLVYATPTVSCDEVKQFCYTAMKVYNDAQLKEPESEWDEMSFLKPVEDETDRFAQDAQQALDLHVRLLGQVLDDGGNDQDVWNAKRTYPFGFILVDSQDWRELGVVVVYCNEKEGQEGVFQVDSGRFKVDQLGFAVTSVADQDDEFARVKETHGSQVEGSPRYG